MFVLDENVFEDAPEIAPVRAERVFQIGFEITAF
jgi:hypothetical protein